jgi:hypothetical protein
MLRYSQRANQYEAAFTSDGAAITLSVSIVIAIPASRRILELFSRQEHYLFIDPE